MINVIRQYLSYHSIMYSESPKKKIRIHDFFFRIKFILEYINNKKLYILSQCSAPIINLSKN